MPLISWSEGSAEEQQKRKDLIEQILPKESIVESYIEPQLMEATKDVLIKALKKEIEVYKAFPKMGKYDPNTFDTRNPSTCFMGQGFRYNTAGLEGWTDAELHRYRAAVGMIDHQEWGKTTLLEIWGADHFKEHPEMVRDVMKYAWGLRKTMPPVEFYVNPFFKNKKTGQMVLTEGDKERAAEATHLSKLGAYIEIRDRLKKAKETNPLNLGLTEADDPQPSRRGKTRIEEDDEDDEEDYDEDED
jgi:hypothetical protein